MVRLSFVFVVSLIVAFAYATPPSKDCVPPPRCRGSNQVYDCRYEWEITWEKCEYRNRTPPFNPGKPNQCRCFCAEGYYRNPDNECVLAEDCPC